MPESFRLLATLNNRYVPVLRARSGHGRWSPGAKRLLASIKAGRHYSSASVGVMEQFMAETRIQAAAALPGARPQHRRWRCAP